MLIKNKFMKIVKVLPGEKFGRLTVIRLAEKLSHKQKRKFVCICDCGKESTVESYHLRSGLIRSCGCLHREIFLNEIKRHGDAHSRFYNIWVNLKGRCNNTRNHLIFDRLFTTIVMSLIFTRFGRRL
jgi:hypothetical protein